MAVVTKCTTEVSEVGLLGSVMSGRHRLLLMGQQSLYSR